MLKNHELIKKQEKLSQANETFWAFCKKLYNSASLDSQLALLEKETTDLRSTITRFRETLETVPLCVAVHKWLKEQAARLSYGEDAIRIFQFLYERTILPTKDSANDPYTLEAFRQFGHSEIIEKIRCQSNLNFTEIEKVVSIYIDFASDLSRLTHGFFPLPVDPDKVKTENRQLALNFFWEFASFLSERDALIAASMYFTGFPLNKILSLQVRQISQGNATLTLESEEASLPKHVIYRLKPFLEGKKTSELVFTGRSGIEVNRSRIFTAFKQASQRMALPKEISPTTLLQTISS